MQFLVSAGEQAAIFEVVFSEDGAQFHQVAGPPAFGILRGRRQPLTELFNEDPPIIHFANGDFLVFNELFELPRGTQRVSLDPTRIATWESI